MMIKCLIVLLTLWFGSVCMAVEEISYTVEKKFNNIEIRLYSSVIVAEVVVSGEINDAASAAFRILFNYIRGNNNNDLKIPMTAPVSLIKQKDDKWDVSFYLPKDMMMKKAPLPSNSMITLKQIKQQKVAVIRFSGRSKMKNLEKHTKQLKQFLTEKNIAFADNPRYAFYNPPFTPWFLRRNEVLFEIIED